MTAEIAVLNKSAVVLAADSAVTIGGGAAAKIFNTANKIFEVSEQNPIGLMVFNRLDFMDLPIEVVAKEFRRDNRGIEYDTVQDCANGFFEYLSTKISCSTETLLLNFEIVASDVISVVEERFNRAVRKQINETGKILRSKFNELLKKELKNEIARLEQLNNAEGFNRVTLTESERGIVQGIAEERFRRVGLQLTKVNLDLFKRFVGASIHKEELSNALTGLVFAGFGKDEICPSIVHYEMDGILSGRLKYCLRNEVDIDRNGPAADVLGFAQDDMVQAFINGVDPGYRQYMQALLREGAEAAGRMILDPVLKDSTGVENFLSGLSDQFDTLAEDLMKRADDFSDQWYTRDVKDMVRSMPKEELATLAESLIEITSLKRKVTRDRETVGGEVDVAVISRSEGLVWVKRKHYFPSELNSRFFERRSRR